MTLSYRLSILAVAGALSIAFPAGRAHCALPDSPIDGFGADLPLEEVVREIVPQGTKIDFSEKVDGAQLVSWQGGASWKGVLKGTLSRVGLIAKISDQGVLIDLAPPPPQKWEVIDGETVAQTIVRWAKQAGYTPVPQFAAQEKWRFFVSQTYEGDFENALDWLSKGYSQQPTKPVFYLGANKTINILSQPTGNTPADAGAGRF